MKEAPKYVLSAGTLATSDAVAALILVDGNRYLMQLRDDIPGIFSPGCWGLFGGSVDEGESLFEALRRELREEIEMEIEEATYFTCFDIDFSFAGFGKYTRKYYVVSCSSDILPTLSSLNQLLSGTLATSTFSDTQERRLGSSEPWYRRKYPSSGATTVTFHPRSER